jgi:hypothetical protein
VPARGTSAGGRIGNWSAEIRSGFFAEKNSGLVTSLLT